MTAAPDYLSASLEPLAPWLGRTDVTDIFVNRPGELWIDTTGGGIERHPVPALDDGHLWLLARQVASFAHQGISREHPLLSARLPGGARIQIVAPPATRGALAIAIRLHVMPDLALADYAAGGGFDDADLHGRTGDGRRATLQALRDAGDVAALLAAAVRMRCNIMVSGGTATGKTTFLNALLREVPADERLVLIEDAPELAMRHPNAVGLVAVRGELGETRVTADDLLTASLRMRPDRIILGELRGGEAGAFLRAVNTGHPGSMTTIHADSPDGALEQLALLVAQGGHGLSRRDVRDYAAGVIDVQVQLDRRGGRRFVSAVRLADRLDAVATA